MKVLKTAVTGTMESSDIMVTIAPNEGAGIEIELDSSVEKQFGKAIRATITETLAELDIQDAKVSAVDKGALDCVIRARVKASAYRACERDDYTWGVTGK
ncbi:citrate lyase acyl carrier protein [Dysosmobacter sp.]|uniref:citrate lyase acyl carrier protein n=1 Tax=Dysosmobacter sp. TaxID=2591382 RepID=UPI002A86AA76|nr:citrate lyase acyl carrier protein [Dysosmobacter sp.]MDY3986163.1 citrate lyase acyl carrier protein [Dysosmobacter sp.]